MDTLRLRDRIRGMDEQITVDLGATVDEVLDAIVTDLGLPRLTPDGDAIGYRLLSSDGERLPGGATLTHLGFGEGSNLALVSPEGQAAWDWVRTMAGRIRTEVQAGRRRVADAARAQARAEGDRVAGAIKEEVRGIVRETTAGIESEISRRIRGVGRSIGLWSRRRIRRLAGEITKTGALPHEMEALALASGRLGAVAQSALIVPLAAAVAVTSTIAVVSLMDRGTVWITDKDLEIMDEGSPSVDVGEDGDFFLATVTGEVYRKSDGDWDELINIQGTAGPAGAPGTAWLLDSGQPSGGLAARDGDLYLDIDSGLVYERTGGEWLPSFSVKGADGQAGLDGTRWIVGSVRPPHSAEARQARVGDFYFDGCEGVVYQRQHGGAWTALIDLAGTQGRLRLESQEASGCVTRVVDGDTLWALVVDSCPDLSGTRETARAVTETWLANLDVIGSDPDQIDQEQTILIRCS